MILSAWFDHVEESFSLKSPVQNVLPIIMQKPVALFMLKMLMWVERSKKKNLFCGRSMDLYFLEPQ